MSQTIDEIEIFAYLAPHPTDDFSGLEGDFLEWIPGFLNENDEKEGIDAIYRNYNLEIYSDENTQSVKKYTSYEEWIDKFIIPPMVVRYCLPAKSPSEAN